jgi:Tat protein secretion system quality control protein TatD with DNase activity
MLIDAHTHLNIAGSDAQGKYNLFANWKEHVKEFQEVGGKILINAGAREDYNEKGILIAREAMTLFPDLIVKTTVGIHPEDTPHDDTTQNPPSPPLRKGIVQLERLYLDNKEHIVAI